MNISVIRRGTALRPMSVARVQRWCGVMLRAMKVRRAELSVLLCDDATITFGICEAGKGKAGERLLTAIARTTGDRRPQRRDRDRTRAAPRAWT